MALTGLAIGAALALAKNEMIDKPAAARKRKLEAATAAYSPWTGLKPQHVDDPNALGAMMQYGGAGAAMGSAINKDDADANLSNSLAENPAVSGDAYTGKNSLGSMDMSSKLQAKDFSGVMGGSPDMGSAPVAADSQPAWFYGDQPSAYKQPSLGSDYATKYKSILNAGLSPENPEDKWSINPWKPKNYGGY